MDITLPFVMLATALLQPSIAINIVDPSPTVEVGNDVTIQCTDETMIVTWYFEDELIMPGGQYAISTANNDTASNLTISNVTIANEGSYVCKTGVSQFSAKLEVYILPVVKVTSVPTSPQIVTGENRTLTCETNSYMDRAKWTRNGNELTESNIMINADKLMIIDSALTDAGSYKCTINITDIAKRLIVGEDTFNVVAQVNVIITKNVKLEEGETARIGCNATGYPTPMVSWFRDSEKMENGSADGRVFFTTVEDEYSELVVMSTLNIRRIKSEDGGLYSCNATNNHTSAGALYLLEVRDPLAALWPFLGIMTEVILLIMVILGVEFWQKKKHNSRNETH